MTFKNPFGDLPKEGVFESNEDAFAQLKDLKPRTSTRSSPPKETAQANELARKAGFNLSNFDEKRLKFRERNKKGPVQAPITMRVQVRDWNKFKRFCDRDGIKVYEGFQLLVSMLPEDEVDESNETSAMDIGAGE